MQRDERQPTEVVKAEQRLETLDPEQLRTVEGGANKVNFTDVVIDVRLRRIVSLL
jgi:hypothetical protein